MLLFLHADTRLPTDADQHIDTALAGGACWGRFDVRIDGRSRWLGLVAAMMNWRSRLTGICTGDQALFVRRDFFEALDGFPDQPLMEDIEWSRRARSRSRPAVVRARATTSGRRWEQRGLWRTIALMWSLRWRYFLGADPASARAHLPRGAVMDAPWQVAILARAAVPGAAKTRLVPRIGVERAAALQAHLTELALRRVRNAGAACRLWIAGPIDAATRRLADSYDAELRIQPDGDLGDRMLAALLDAQSRGLRGLVIGTDCPAQRPDAPRARPLDCSKATTWCCSLRSTAAMC